MRTSIYAQFYDTMFNIAIDFYFLRANIFVPIKMTKFCNGYIYILFMEEYCTFNDLILKGQREMR